MAIVRFPPSLFTVTFNIYKTLTTKSERIVGNETVVYSLIKTYFQKWFKQIVSNYERHEHILEWTYNFSLII